MARSGDNDDFEVAKIIKQRRNYRGRLEYLVRWKNYSSEEDTWEPVENLRNCMDLLDAFHDCLMQEKGPFAKSSPPQKRTQQQHRQGHLTKRSRGAKTQSRVKEETHYAHAAHGHAHDHAANNKRCFPIRDELKVVIKKERAYLNGGLPLAAAEASLSSPSSFVSSTDSASSVGSGGGGAQAARKVNRSRSMSCVSQDLAKLPVINGGDGGFQDTPAKRRRVQSLLIEDSKTLGTDKSLDKHTTPPSTPTSSETQLTLTPLLTPVVKLHDCQFGSHFKLPSPKSLLSTEKFLRSKLQPKDSDIADRFAENFALRRFSQSSMSSEDLEETERRFSLRQCDNVSKYKEIVVKKHSLFTQVWFFTNSPSRNYLNIKALQELTDVLEKSAKDETRLLLLTGSGNVFCSGIDLENLVIAEQRKKYAKNLAEALRVFINALIAFPKVIVAAVNGRAVGLGAAILPLCDIVYSSDKAEFHLPYTALGQTPEACSSFTFPNAMGLPVACDLLYSGRRMTALEACASGLVSQVFWPASFMREVIPRVKIIASNSAKGLQMTKSLVRSHLKAKLEFTNESECQALQERWASTECIRLIRKHLELK